MTGLIETIRYCPCTVSNMALHCLVLKQLAGWDTYLCGSDERQHVSVFPLTKLPMGPVQLQGLLK